MLRGFLVTWMNSHLVIKAGMILGRLSGAVCPNALLRQKFRLGCLSPDQNSTLLTNFLGFWMIFSFHCTNLCWIETVLLPLFSSNIWSTWELSKSKSWKRHYYIYLIFGDERRIFLNISERRKRIVNILKREKSLRMGDNFSKNIKKIDIFLYLTTICASSRLPVIPEKLHQKSTRTP